MKKNSIIYSKESEINDWQLIKEFKILRNFSVRWLKTIIADEIDLVFAKEYGAQHPEADITLDQHTPTPRIVTYPEWIKELEKRITRSKMHLEVIKTKISNLCEL